MADQAVELFGDAGLNLDFSVASVAALDVHLNEQMGPEGIDRQAAQWRPSQRHRRSIVLIGSYLGEVIRVRFGGAWTDDPNHVGKPLFTALSLGDFGRVLPLERAYRRLKNGDASPLLSVLFEIEANVPRIGDHGDAMAWAGQAADFLKRDRIDQANHCLDAALGLDPKLPEGWLCAAMIAERLGKLDEALAAYTKAARFAAPSDDQLRSLCERRVLAIQTKLGEAPTPTDIDPLAPTEWGTADFPAVGAGNTQIPSRNELSQPVPRGATPVASDSTLPTESDAWRRLNAGRPDEAETLFARLLSAQDEPDIRTALALTQLLLERPEEALLTLEPVARSHIDACVLRARALSKLGKFSEALEAIHALPAGLRGLPDIRQITAEVLAADGRPSEARKTYEALVRNATTLPSAWLGLANVAKAQGDQEAAHTAFRAYIALSAGQAHTTTFRQFMSDGDPAPMSQATGAN